jgi:ADP-ribose pyrophosphatase YjhB (NUDIX family)
MEDIWLAWAKRLQSVASTGLHFARDEYDRERYAQVSAIANEMLSSLAGVPVGRIEGLLSDFAKGYETPKVDVRGAVFDDEKILLVRERSDDLWTLPGGYADVGMSASENVVKEIREEASLGVRVQALYGIRHKAKHEYAPDLRDFYKLFFLCERTDGQAPQPGLETAEVGFFAMSELPPLSKGRTLEKDIVAAFAFKADPQRLALFD